MEDIEQSLQPFKAGLLYSVSAAALICVYFIYLQRIFKSYLTLRCSTSATLS